MKLTRTQRLIRIVQLLQAGRHCGVDWLADELSVSRRTVFRDMNILKDAGIRCEYDSESESYRIEHAHYLRPLNLSMDEALGLMLLTRKFIDDRLIPGYSAALSGGLKIESSMPQSVRDHCGELLEAVEVDQLRMSDVDPVSDVLVRAQGAIAKRHKLQMRYDSYYDKAEIEVVLHPYRLACRSRGWYVIGRSERHREVRTFKLDRILDFSVLDKTFRMPRDFSLEEYYGNAWNMVRGERTCHVQVHFSKMVAGNVEEVAWHPTQRTRRRSDGSLVFEVDVDGIDEIAWWILGYGDQAIVSEPPELRQLIASHARQLVNLYDTNTVTPTSRR